MATQTYYLRGADYLVDEADRGASSDGAMWRQPKARASKMGLHSPVDSLGVDRGEHLEVQGRHSWSIE
jgi:hypothetical protein